MKSNKSAIIILVCLAIQATIVSADLPIHCLKEQVLGKWILKEGRVLAEDNNEPVSCGHTTPDKEATSYKAMNGLLVEVLKEVEVSLDDDFVVRGKEGQGKWTLVYDEGWEIEYNGVKYTHFFKYLQTSTGTYKSSCSSTLVGWFNHVQKKSRGCSQAFKKDADVNEVSDNIVQAHVVQPKDVNAYVFSEIPSTQKKAEFTSESIYMKPNHQILSQMPNSFEEGTNLNHNEIVRRLNTIEGKTWTAKAPHFVNQMTLEKMNKRAGIRQNKAKFVFDNKSGSFIQKSQKNEANTDYAHYSREDVSHLPIAFTWEKYLHPVRSQEDCGSCYAIATTAMIQARNWIKNGDNTQLSPQHSLDCNYYNQGCDGGYGFLTSKFYSEFEAVPESCHPYQAVDGQCSRCDVSKLETIYTVTDYEYIGGSYGKSSERLIMEEIHKNGPVVVSFEPRMDFMYYNSGVYHSVDANKWIQNNEEKPAWQKVDHSVLCYGWGEDENGKFWLLQNSWGPSWGENGSFRMRRGTDDSNIESMGERASVTRKQRKSNSTTTFASKYSSNKEKRYPSLLQKQSKSYKH